MLGVSQFERATKAHIRVGDLPVDPQPPFEFNLSWSAEKLLDDYTGPVRMIEDGAIVSCEALNRLEAIDFPTPFGTLEAFCTAGGLQRLPDELFGKVDHLDLKTIRWPGHGDRMRFLLALGLGDSLSVDVRTHLTYRDLLLRRMRQRMGAEQDDAVLMRIVVHGRAEGTQRTLRYEMIERSAGGLSAMKRSTSIPAAVVACQLARGDVRGGGASTPEMVLPGEIYLNELREHGLHISETWSDGHQAVAEA
jgi:saccharopine dehydrogenase-like NADP-dependent oxidoreductase